MMRIHHCLLLYCILTALVVSQAKGQPAGTANFDPRPLNSDDVEQYLPQVCQGAQVAASGYSCQAMKGYPGGEATL